MGGDPSQAASIILFGALTAAYAFMRSIKHIIVRPQHGLQKSLHIAYVWFLGLSVLLTTVFAFSAQQFLKQPGLAKLTLKALAAIMVMGIPVYLYIFVRHSHLLKTEMMLPDALQGNTPQNKHTFVCQGTQEKKERGKRKEDPVDPEIPIFAMLIYSRVLLALMIVAIIIMAAMGGAPANAQGSLMTLAPIPT